MQLEEYKVSIIIPVYNEEPAIREILRQVCAAPLPAGFKKEVVVVDDGSVDETADIIEEFRDENHGRIAAEIKFHRGLVNHGKGSALRAGFVLATGDIFLVQDGDLEYSPKDYIPLLEPFRQREVDVVYGTRFAQGIPKGMKWANALANLILTYATCWLYGQRISDEATGFKAFRAKVLEGIELRCRRFEFCPEFTGKISIAGFKIHEVPIRYNPRGILEGKKIRASDGFIALWWLTRIRLRSLLPLLKQRPTAISQITEKG